MVMEISRKIKFKFHEHNGTASEKVNVFHNFHKHHGVAFVKKVY